MTSTDTVIHNLHDLLGQAQGYLERGEASLGLNLLVPLADQCAQVPAFWLMLLKLYQQQGQDREVEACLDRIVVLVPDSLESHGNLALVAEKRGDLDKALRQARQVLRLNPMYPNLGTWMASLCKTPERIAEVRVLLTEMLVQYPGHVEFYRGLARLSLLENDFSEAERYYRRALDTGGDQPDLHFDVGLFYYRQGRSSEAETCFRQAVALEPQHAAAWQNLGLLLSRRHLSDEAEVCLNRSIEADPNRSEAYELLSHLLHQQGLVDEARAVCQKAVDLDPADVIRQINQANICPVIMESNAQIDGIYAGYDAFLTALEKKVARVELEHVCDASARPSFYLSYYGRDNLAIKSRLADYYERAFLHSGYGDLMKRPAYQPEGPIHVGFVVTITHEQVFNRVLAGLVTDLSRDPRFRVSVACSAVSAQIMRPHLPENTRFVHMSEDLRVAVPHLKGERFDVLYYLEVNSDAFNYFLPFFNLAPVQCTSWGIPETTGIRALDYFLSSTLWETPEGPAHYRETLVQFPRLPVFYKRPSPLETQSRRADFGLPEGIPLYCCPHQTFKFHPDLIDTLASLLAQDPEGKLLIFESLYKRLQQRMSARLSRRIPDFENRVMVLPRLTAERFVTFMALPDVVFLDTFYYDGGITTYDGLAVGAPIITLPGPWMRGRKTLGCYRQMNLMDAVADSPADYVEKAIRFAHDAEAREGFREKIITQSGVLYDDPTVAPLFAQFVEQALAHRFA